jgi:hypothetical protein
MDTDTDTGSDTGSDADADADADTGTGLVQFPMGERLHLYLSALARIPIGEITRGK